MVILREPGGYLRGKGSVIRAIPGRRGSSIARRPVYLTSLEPLAQVPGSLDTFLGNRNQGNLWGRFHTVNFLASYRP